MLSCEKRCANLENSVFKRYHHPQMGSVLLMWGELAGMKSAHICGACVAATANCNTFRRRGCYWLASQMVEMRLWRSSEHDVRAALEQDISELGVRSWFVKVADDEWALRSWSEQ